MVEIERLIYCRVVYYIGGDYVVRVNCSKCNILYYLRPSEVRLVNLCSPECGSRSDARRVHRICEECGREFMVEQYQIPRGKGRYCTTECYNKARTTSVTLVCLNCNESFTVRRYRKDDAKFCSMKCMVEFNNVDDVERTCEWCNRKFSLPPSTVKSNGGKFCSQECHYESIKNQVERICENCGEKFSVCQSMLKYNASKYCSRKCSGEGHTGENNWMYGRCGSLSPSWKGGISFEPYCPLWTPELRRRIRAFFNYECIICGKSQDDNGQAMSCHHVEYNKMACCDGKLVHFVAVCRECHGKTGGLEQNRNRWEAIIHQIIDEIYDGRSYFTKEEWKEIQSDSCL